MTREHSVEWSSVEWVIGDVKPAPDMDERGVSPRRCARQAPLAVDRHPPLHLA